MFVANALLYPCALAALCLGAGLLVERACWRLPAPLLVSIGAAALIALSQLTTYVAFLAPATPYAMAGVAVLGFVLARDRVRGLGAAVRAHPAVPFLPVLAYAIALAPVLLSGRATFSSFMALSDSAVHLIGADFLIRHGQSYGGLDLRNSYGQFINDYYNTSYPSGADTMFGGSARLLGLPLIWAFQPFTAFMLASASGPAWLLARRIGLTGAWAFLAALTAVVPALVYGYELIGSIKEITCLSMLLSSGCLVVLYPRWMRAGPTGAIPLALVLAAGISALGVAFGVWAAASVAVLAVALAVEMRARRVSLAQSLALVGAGALTGLIAALPTWSNLSGSIRVAGNIASTENPGNLHSALRAIQVFGVWLGGSYKLQPTGSGLTATHLLVAAAFVSCALGVLQLLRVRAFSLLAWLALLLLAWLVVSESVTTWASAKTLMLTSPAVVLLAWGGVAAMRALLPRTLGTTMAALLALALTAGVLLSDALQYHSSDLAPTGRYRELASIDSRFAGRGPTLFTDFDEYSMYVLRDLDVGGPDFVYPPAGAATAAGGYGNPVDINRISPAVMAEYPLIVDRRDPAAVRPPAAYELAWQGAYYQVWARRPGAVQPALHRALSGGTALQCVSLGQTASIAAARFGPRPRLLAAEAPELVTVSLAGASHPAGWGHERRGLVMSRPGRLDATFQLPAGGVWEVWVQGELMPAIRLRVDGRALASIAGQLSGNSLVPDTIPPIPVSLSAGTHTVSVQRGGFTLAPGDGGSAVLDSIFLTPAAEPPAGTLRVLAASHWRELCGRRYEWVEVEPG